jgi:hypothetical protein
MLPEQPQDGALASSRFACEKHVAASQHHFERVPLVGVQVACDFSHDRGLFSVDAMMMYRFPILW